MTDSVSTSVRMTVPFYDVDIMQVVWNGHYFKYFEVVRQALFKKYGIDFSRYLNEKKYVFPVIRSKIKHIYPLRLEDEFICIATLKEAKVKIVIDFEIRLVNDGKVCAKGQSEQAAFLVSEMEMALKIPEEIQKAFYSDK